MRFRRRGAAHGSLDAGAVVSGVIVRLPGGLSSDGIEVFVPVNDFETHTDGVLVRPAHSSQRWERLSAVGGSVEVRQ